MVLVEFGREAVRAAGFAALVGFDGRKDFL